MTKTSMRVTSKLGPLQTQTRLSARNNKTAFPDADIVDPFNTRFRCWIQEKTIGNVPLSEQGFRKRTLIP